MLVVTTYFPAGRLRAADVTTGAEKNFCEVPPHPDRVFQAFVDAYGARGRSASGRAAFAWFESLPPPVIRHDVPDFFSILERQLGPAVAFVPINDRVPTGSDRLFPRSRKPRQFPGVHVGDARIHYVWPDADPSEHLETLRDLASVIAAIGPASSVACVEVGTAPPPDLDRLQTLTPVPLGELKLRVPHTVRFAALEAWWASDRRRHAGEGVWQGYEIPRPQRPRIVQPAFDGLIPMRLVPVMTRSGLALTDILRVVAALRGAVLSHSPVQPAPEILTGHAPGSSPGAPLPSRNDHLAYVPLGYVGSAHADGRLLGIGGSIPRAASEGERQLCLETLARVVTSTITPEDLGIWRLSTDPEDLTLHSLDPEAWCRPSRAWATVTPFVCGPGRLGRSIARACEQAGLPVPEAYRSGGAPFLPCPANCVDFPALNYRGQTFGGAERLLVHLWLRWAQPIAGPLALGAGRYTGYGNLWPVEEDL
jgi:CRISPR-associated protein Csb2